MGTSGYREGNLEKHVRAAFSGTAAPAPEEFLGELRANWREALDRGRRVGLQLVLLFALFALLVDANVSEIAFAGVKLRPEAVELIATALPALIAYLFAKYWELYILISRYETVHIEICQQRFPALDPLDKALHPPEIYDPTMYEFIHLERNGTGNRWLRATSMIAGTVGFVLPFLFVIGCYVALLVLASPSWLAFAVSALAAIFFLVRTASFLPSAMALEEDLTSVKRG